MAQDDVITKDEFTSMKIQMAKQQAETRLKNIALGFTLTFMAGAALVKLAASGQPAKK